MNLNDPVTTIPGVGESYAQKLENLNVSTIRDLLYHIPHRYLDFRNVSQSNNVQIEETYTISGTIAEITNTYTRKRKRITQATLTDETGSIQIVWFNQTYLTKVIQPGDTLRISGKVTWWDRKKAMIAPMWKKLEDAEQLHGDIVPIYSETEGVTSKWLSKTINKAWNEVKDSITDNLPTHIVESFSLPTLTAALNQLHFPDDLEKTNTAKYRLAFDEMYTLLSNSRERRQRWNQQSVTFTAKNAQQGELIISFVNNLPFPLTNAQHRVVKEILTDMEKDQPMNRLLQGDVGAGKTVVAAVGAVSSQLHGKQTIFLAPTEVLAQQHASTLNDFFSTHPTKIALVTGSTKSEDFANADILVGTHALFNQKDMLSPAGLIVIDEQHKFGVEQRATLITGYDTVPHVLTMTATPIPRSIALTLYGDQDVSLLDELPPGRLPVKTWVVPENKRNASYTWIAEQLQKDQMTTQQAIFVYPLIEESDHETMTDVKSVTQAYEQLKKQFSDFNVNLIHGRMPAKEKNKIIERFRNGDIDILVTTSVIEVGIDAPDATIMVVENAERFGLATLHQLRGRVGRRGQQAYCFLFTPTDDEITLTRLKAMETHHNGLKLAEIDLELRGPGQLFGTRQHGIGELRFANITDLKLIKQVKAALDASETHENPY